MWLIISVVLPTYWYSSQREKQRSRGDAWYTTPEDIQPADWESLENHRMDTGSTPRRSLASLLLCHLNINFPPQDRLATHDGAQIVSPFLVCLSVILAIKLKEVASFHSDKSTSARQTVGRTSDDSSVNLDIETAPKSLFQVIRSSFPRNIS